MAIKHAPHDFKNLGGLRGIQSDTSRSDVDHAYGAARVAQESLSGQITPQIATLGSQIAGLSSLMAAVQGELADAHSSVLFGLFATLDQRLEAIESALAAGGLSPVAPSLDFSRAADAMYLPLTF